MRPWISSIKTSGSVTPSDISAPRPCSSCSPRWTHSCSGGYCNAASRHQVWTIANDFLVKVEMRLSYCLSCCMSSGGTKLPLTKFFIVHSAIHSASATSLLCPGSCLMKYGLTSRRRKWGQGYANRDPVDARTLHGHFVYMVGEQQITHLLKLKC